MNSELLACFFRGCETHFGFLGHEPGFSAFSGMASYERGRIVIRPFDEQNVPENFSAVAHYERGDDAVEILYEENGYTLSVFLTYGRVDRLSLAEMVKAGGKRAPRAESHLTQCAQLEHALERFASCFRQHSALLIEPKAALLEKARAARSAQINEELRRRARENMGFACKQAALAYIEKDWRRVVALLTRFERELTGYDLKKLEVARRKLIS